MQSPLKKAKQFGQIIKENGCVHFTYMKKEGLLYFNKKKLMTYIIHTYR